MAAVPEMETLPSVAPQPAGTPSVGVNLPTTVGGAIGKGLEGMGQSADQLGNALAQHAIKLATINNQATADTATQGFVKESESLRAQFDTDNQYVDPSKSGAILADYQQKLEAIRQKYRGSLGNLMAQTMYDSDSRRMQNILFSNGATTVAHGAEVYRQKAFDGQQELYASAAAATSDPAQQEDIKNQAAQAAYARGTQLNMPESMVKAGVLQSTSGINASIIEQQLKTDAKAAWAYFQANKGEMTAKDQGIYAEKIQQQLYGQLGAEIGDRAHTQAQTFSPTGPVTGDADGVFKNGILWAETRNGQGSFLNTQSGAEGIGQLMPKTAQGVAQRLGLPWRPDLMQSKDPAAVAYQTQLSEAYWHEAVTAEHGDLYRAAEYYYGGPNEAQWGPKTKAYAANVLSHVQGEGGQLTNLQANVPAAYKSIDDQVTQAATQYGLNPDVLKANVQSKFEGDVRRDEWAHDQGVAAIKGDIISAIMGDGTPAHPPITDITQLPSLPGWDQLLPQERRQMQAITTQQLQQSSQVLQYQIEGKKGQPGGSNWFLGQDFTSPEYHTRLTPTAINDLIKEQISLRNKNEREENYNVTYQQVKTNPFLNDALTAHGITKPDGTITDQAKYDTFVGAMFTEMRVWHANNPNVKGAIPQDVLAQIGKDVLSRNLVENEPLLSAAGRSVEARTGETADPWQQGERAEQYEYARRQLIQARGVEPSPSDISRFVKLKFGTQ